MNNRNYNIFFHLHTVSGIVISVVLYVIFFAGSFAFFRDDIANWERGESSATSKGMTLDYNKALHAMDTAHDLHARTFTISKHHKENFVNVYLEPSKDTVNVSKKGKESAFFYLDQNNFTTTDYVSSYNLGEFLYRLHFLAQVPYPVGYYLSGFIALFFVFATVTGVLTHWKKIVSNFYIFRPKEKLKTLWTDAHTALGMLGLPFQFVYGITGAFFMIKLLVVAPSVVTLYNGDDKKLYQELEYSKEPVAYANIPLDKKFDLNELVAKTEKKWPGFQTTEIAVQNYGDQNMQIEVGGEFPPSQKNFTAMGHVTYKIGTGEEISIKDPITQNTYLDGVKNVLYRIHFGDYGGYGLRIISFGLGILSCFVIISGVMIWLVARDKKGMPEKKRRFNEGVVNYYLAICLSMYPVTALTFIAAKVFYPLGQSNMYSVYFLSWLVLTVFFVIKKNFAFTNYVTLLMGSILGFFIPIANGIMTETWFWTNFSNHRIQPFFIDVFWIILSATTLWVYFKIKPKKQEAITT